MTAKVLENISNAEPKVIALNVLYSEPADESIDEKLTEAIRRNGKVVVGEQLIEDQSDSNSAKSVWLRTLPQIDESNCYRRFS